MQVHVVTAEAHGVVGTFSSARRAHTASLTAVFPGDGDVATQTFQLDKEVWPLGEPPKVEIYCNSSAPPSQRGGSVTSDADDDDEDEDDENSDSLSSYQSSDSDDSG